MHIRIVSTAAVLSFAFIFFISCSGGKMEEKQSSFDSIENVPDSVWQKLSKKKFYFGHKSVGYNIIDGVQDFLNQHPQIKLNIIESTNPDDLTPGTLSHSQVGKNTKPNTKIEDFVKYIDGGIGQKADAVALKFCYIDFMADTESETILAAYEKEIDRIRESFPNLAIIHFTSPLTTLQTGPKAWVKKLIGRPVYGVNENINRFRYNELLRAKYLGKEPVLDIATIESTYPDGTRATFEVDGKTYYNLVPVYTDDGGHLNEVGRKKVAEQLILMLADLS